MGLLCKAGKRISLNLMEILLLADAHEIGHFAISTEADQGEWDLQMQSTAHSIDVQMDRRSLSFEWPVNWPNDDACTSVNWKSPSGKVYSFVDPSNTFCPQVRGCWFLDDPYAPLEDRSTNPKYNIGTMLQQFRFTNLWNDKNGESASEMSRRDADIDHVSFIDPGFGFLDTLHCTRVDAKLNSFSVYGTPTMKASGSEKNSHSIPVPHCVRSILTYFLKLTLRRALPMRVVENSRGALIGQ